MRYGPESSGGVSNMRQDNGSLHYSLFSAAPGPVATELGSTLNDLQLAAYTKIIMGEESPDYFDTFVGQWKNAGGDRLTAEISQWYKDNK
jgi:putative aldouronate transport system substrate-binding protein